ncbi:MAG: hypothetical protein ABR497_11265 [Kiritimatiellia bacterium]|nr:hypothetical protein [Lentisphaerota bacterium]
MREPLKMNNRDATFISPDGCDNAQPSTKKQPALLIGGGLRVVATIFAQPIETTLQNGKTIT